MLNTAHKMLYHTPLIEIFDSRLTILMLINTKGRIFNNHYIDTTKSSPKPHSTLFSV